MSKVALIAAAGTAGSRILGELLSRGHQVTAIVRNPEKLISAAGLIVVQGDANQPEALAKQLEGHDAVISAAKFVDVSPENLLTAVKTSGVKRYIVVGGAGSLRAPDGSLEMDSPRFPAHVKPEAVKGGEFLELLRHEEELEWTFISPSRFFTPGSRTGSFRLGHDDMLFAADGTSKISMEDYAIALVDELETGAHIRGRFTVGY